MTVSDVILHHRFILAVSCHAVLIIAGLVLIRHLENKQQHILTNWMWQAIIEPLYRAFVLVCFIFIAYPVIFGLEQADSISMLLSVDEDRSHHLLNLVFISSLLLPLLPVIGKWTELILPIQAILCCMMVFSWLAASLGIEQYSLWPGTFILVVIVMLALLTHFLSVQIAKWAGDHLDQHFNVTGFEKIIAEIIILFMQAPAVVIYSLGLGRQILIS